MAKPKLDIQQLMLDKGEKIILFAGLGVMGLLLLLGIMVIADAPDAAAEAQKQIQLAQQKEAAMFSGAVTEDIKLPPWAERRGLAEPVRLKDHLVSIPYFDPIASFDNKRMNPEVLTVIEMQADAIRAKLRAYDYLPPTEKGGKGQIGVLIARKDQKDNNKKAQDAWKNFRSKQGSRPKSGQGGGPGNLVGPGGPGGPGGLPLGPGGPGDLGGSGGPGGFPMGPGGPGGPGGFPMGPGGPGRLGGGGMMPPGGQGYPGMDGPGYGGMGFDLTARRMEVQYIDEDKELSADQIPAETIFPVRMVVVNATLPYRAQLDAFHKALRIPKEQGLGNDYPQYLGFRVQRKVLTLDGKVFSDWKPLDYKRSYADVIHIRKIEDAPDDNLAYAITPINGYGQELVLPLPALIDTSYPPITRLPKLKEMIDRQAELAKGAQPQVNSFANRRRSEGIFQPTYSSGQANQPGAGLMNPGGFPMGSGGPGAGPGMQLPGVRPPAGGFRDDGPGFPGSGGPNQMQSNFVDPDYALVRFIDTDVQPGRKYMYRIQMVMQNPNWNRGDKNDPINSMVSIPEDANIKELVSPWSEVMTEQDAVAFDEEQFIYALDRAPERLKDKLEEAWVQIHRWYEQIPLSERIKEPVGDWVIGEVKAQRGQPLGGKKYVELPLWSSEFNMFLIRIPSKDAPVRGRPAKITPEGVEIDLFLPYLVADLDGGKRSFKTSKNSNAVDESATEILLFSPRDGTLRVLNSAIDREKPEREARERQWKAWIAKVKENRPNERPSGPANPFAQPAGPGAGPGGNIRGS